MPFTQSQIQDIKGLIVESISEILNENLIDSLVKKVVDKIQLNDIRDSLRTQNKEISDLKSNDRDIAVKIDFLEQQLNKNKIRVSGIPEQADEEKLDEVMTQMFSRKMHLQFNAEDFELCYRTGAKRAGLSRTVIVKFHKYKHVATILENRRKLKGEKIFINEALTKRRYDIFKSALSQFGKGKVWTRSGNIYVKVNQIKHNIVSIEDMQKLVS